MHLTKSNNVEAIAKTFCHWLHRSGEANPRRATLSVFIEVNFITTDKVEQQVWDTYLNYL